MFSLRIALAGLLAVSLFSTEPATALDAERLFAPIKVDPQAKTWRDVLKVHHVWAERVLLAPLRERSAGQPWSAAANDFAVEGVDKLIFQPDQNAPEVLREAGERLLKDGCRDPLVVYLATRFDMLVDGGGGVCHSRFSEAFAGAEKLAGPKALAWLIARDLRKMKMYDPAVGNVAPQNFSRLARAVVTDGSYTEAEDSLFFAHLLFPDPAEAFNPPELLAPLLDAPVGEWLRNIIRGRYEAELASHTRDDQFRLHRQQAREAYMRAWEVHPNRPEAATGMIAISVSEEPMGSPVPRQWFDRAVAAQFDYPPAYEAVLAMCHPGSGGSEGLTLAFGEACRETGRMDTAVPSYYFAATYYLAKLQRDGRNLFRRPDISRATIELSRARVEEPSRQKARKSNLEYFAVNAFLAGDVALAARLRRETGPLSLTAMEKLRDFEIYDFEEQIRSVESGATDLRERAKNLRTEGKLAAAQEALTEALSHCQPAERLQLEWQIADLDFQRKFESGEWIARPADSADPAWAGTPWATPRRKIGQPPKTPIFRVVHAYTVGTAVEIRGEFPAPPKASTDSTTLHVFIGTRYFADRPVFSLPRILAGAEIFAKADGGHRVRLRDNLWPIVPEEVPVSLRERNTFVIRLERSQASFVLNGEVIFENVPFNESSDADKMEFIFGYDAPPGAALAPEKIEMRKLLPKLEELRKSAQKLTPQRNALLNS